MSTNKTKKSNNKASAKEYSKKHKVSISQNYLIKGMHCASCAILIEKEVGEMGVFENINVSRKEDKLSLTLKNKSRKFPTLKELNSAVNPFGYEVLAYKDKRTKGKGNRGVKDTSLISFKNGSLIINKEKLSSFIFVLVGLVLIFWVYKIFEHWGIVSAVNVNENSKLSVFFLFGIVAGLSSCFALVGSIVLSMSKKWYDSYKGENSTLQKMFPHLLFNIGRLVSFFVFGGILGLLGEMFSISENVIAIFSIVIAIVIILTGFQLIGLKLIPDIEVPVKIKETKFKGLSLQRVSPFITGFLTFFLPCGFTLTAQGIAILSSNFWGGAFIMLIFALGTMPTLLLVGFSVTKFYANNNISKQIIKLVAVLIIIFGFSIINLQLVRLGLPNFKDLTSRIFSSSSEKVTSAQNDGLPPIVDGKQIVKSRASANGYTPETIYVRKGIPVRWEITDVGTSGCSNAIIAKDFFQGRIELTLGNTSVKEFTPQKVGTFRYSCWMGMITGTIVVVE